MMAVDLHNCELLLPCTFISEQEEESSVVSVTASSNQPINRNISSLVFYPSESGSELSSSELGSSTESSEEEDNYIAELTRRMAQCMLQDGDKHERPRRFHSSPESTIWRPLCSNHESPIGPSREPSPPLTPIPGNLEAMKIHEEMARCNDGERPKNTPTSVSVNIRNPTLGFQPEATLIDDQLRAIQKLKEEQAMRQMDQKHKIRPHQNKGRASWSNNGQKAAFQSCSWYTLQQQQQQGSKQSGSDMRAVFLNSSGSRTGSCGTGVFLPRGLGTPCESRKKQGCSTVLIPARVVQALKVHFEKTGLPSRFNTDFPTQQDAFVGRANSSSSHQKRHSRAAPAINKNNQEMGLPQEWTY